MKAGKNQAIHFVGIGGIGVSSLARFYLSQGTRVTGSDLSRSELTEELADLGARVIWGKHRKNNIPPKTTLVIHTPAAQKDHPELIAARKKHIRVKSYPEALGELTKQFETITISGTHGKSTTTAMTALVLEEGYCDPTVIIGTKVPEFNNSNFHKGLGKYLLIEADEWNKSFLNYHPKIAAITNIDSDHLDTYGTIANIEKTFTEYLHRVPPDGKIIANADDPRLTKIAKRFVSKVRWYSRASADADVLRAILRVPGEHNVSNALAAMRIGELAGISRAHILKALSRFTGTWRRFELKGIVNNAFVFTDYGHHPTEIQATLSAARSTFPFRRIWCVYQPHQYERLYRLWNDFIQAFDQADHVCLLPVYDVAGRESEIAKTSVNSQSLAHELELRGKHITNLTSLLDAKKYINEHARPSDIILVMGAGDIHKLNSFLI